MLQPFKIRELHGSSSPELTEQSLDLQDSSLHNATHDRRGIVRLSASQYDDIATNHPRAQLTYLDEDDGELITVGSSLELSQRLDEPPDAFPQPEPMHIFDIRRSNSVTELWKRFEDKPASQGNQATDTTTAVILNTEPSHEIEQTTEVVAEDTSAATRNDSEPLLAAFEIEMAKILSASETLDEGSAQRNDSSPSPQAQTSTTPDRAQHPIDTLLQSVQNLANAAERLGSGVRSRYPELERHLHNAQRAIPGQIEVSVQAIIATLEQQARNMVSTINSMAANGQMPGNMFPSELPTTLERQARNLVNTLNNMVASGQIPVNMLPSELQTSQGLANMLSEFEHMSDTVCGTMYEVFNTQRERIASMIQPQGPAAAFPSPSVNETEGHSRPTDGIQNENSIPPAAVNPPDSGTNLGPKEPSNLDQKEDISIPLRPKKDAAAQDSAHQGSSGSALAGTLQQPGPSPMLAAPRPENAPSSGPPRPPYIPQEPHLAYSPFDTNYPTIQAPTQSIWGCNMPPSNSGFLDRNHHYMPRPPVPFGFSPSHPLNYTGWPGQGVSLNHEAPPSKDNTPTAADNVGDSALFIGNIGYKVDGKMIREVFAAKGFLVNVHLPLDSETRKHAGFGYLHLPSSHAAKAALDALQGTHIDGHSINLELSDPSPITTLNTTNDTADSTNNPPRPNPSELPSSSRRHETEIERPLSTNVRKPLPLSVADLCSNQNSRAGEDASSTTNNLDNSLSNSERLDTLYPSLLPGGNTRQSEAKNSTPSDHLLGLSRELEECRFPPVSQLDAHFLAEQRREVESFNPSTSKSERNPEGDQNVTRDVTSRSLPGTFPQDLPSRATKKSQPPQNSRPAPENVDNSWAPAAPYPHRSRTCRTSHPSRKDFSSWGSLGADTSDLNQPLRRRVTDHPRSQGGCNSASFSGFGHGPSRQVRRTDRQPEVDPRQYKIDECVATLASLGYGSTEEGGLQRIAIYAAAVDGKVSDAIEMIEEERKVYQQQGSTK